MKKILLITAIAAIAAGSAFGQGAVVFANSSTKPVLMADGTAVTRSGLGGTYAAELWAANDFLGGDQQAAFDLVAMQIGGPAAFGTPANGVFSGGNRTITSIDPAGGPGLFQVRVYDTRGGNSYAVASRVDGYQAGQSVIFRSDTDDPADTAPAVPLNTAFVPFQLSIVPEPSVFALGVLGAGALLMLRRRK